MMPELWIAVGYLRKTLNPRRDRVAESLWNGWPNVRGLGGRMYVDWVSAFAYRAARHYARDPRFAFGTWKIEILAGYTSAILLVCIAVIMAMSSVERLLSPQPIHYQEAMFVAGIGLAVNLARARELLHVAPALPTEGVPDEPAKPTFVCPDCGAAMIVVETLARKQMIRAPPQHRGTP